MLTLNDTDANGDPLTITAVDGATNGTVVLDAGNITFTPTPGFSGAAGFTYTLSDGRGGEATGNVTVSVVPAPQGNPIVAENATHRRSCASVLLGRAEHSNADRRLCNRHQRERWQPGGLQDQRQRRRGQPTTRSRSSVSATTAATARARSPSGRTRNATVQPGSSALRSTTRGLVDAGNWAVTDSWDVPAERRFRGLSRALQRLDANGNPIPARGEPDPLHRPQRRRSRPTSSSRPRTRPGMPTTAGLATTGVSERISTAMPAGR